jgi:hypothetical protein
MGKYAPSAMMDGSLDYVRNSNLMIACSTQPTTYDQAFTTYKIASVPISSGSFTKADATSGRKLVLVQKPLVDLVASGSATHVALVDTVDSVLRYVTTCTTKYLIAGGVTYFPEWEINVQAPT